MKKVLIPVLIFGLSVPAFAEWTTLQCTGSSFSSKGSNRSPYSIMVRFDGNKVESKSHNGGWSEEKLGGYVNDYEIGLDLDAKIDRGTGHLTRYWPSGQIWVDATCVPYKQAF